MREPLAVPWRSLLSSTILPSGVILSELRKRSLRALRSRRIVVTTDYSTNSLRALREVTFCKYCGPLTKSSVYKSLLFIQMANRLILFSIVNESQHELPALVHVGHFAELL